MSEFKGTKGNWYVYGDKYPTIQSSNTDKNIIVNYPTIATINSVFISDDVVKANALLISKAPEMLEMLESIVLTWDSNDNFDEEYFNNIKQLIREATQL